MEISWRINHALHSFLEDMTDAFILIFIDLNATDIRHESHLLASFVLGAPIIFPFLTDHEKFYLMQLFVNNSRCIYGPETDENMHNPRLAPMIRFAMQCKKLYLDGNVMIRPISNGELEVIPRMEGLPVRIPTRRESISMLNDIQRLGVIKRRMSSWLDPINMTIRRIFILACRKKQIKFDLPKEIDLPKEMLRHIMCHLWNLVE